MESVDFGILLAGATPYNDKNINQVWKGIVQTHTEDKLAFVKKIDSPYELYIECVCALIGRALDLPIPKPIIVQIPADYTGTSNSVLGYGSEDAGFPSFRRYVNENQNYLDKLFNFKKTLDVAVFDEIIGNWDRNIGNMLYDGGNDFVFIDHGKSIEKILDNHSPAKDNQLIRVLYSGQLELDRYRYLRISHQGIIANYGKLSFTIIPAKTYASAYVKDEDIVHVFNFLSNRLNYIDHLLKQRLGIPPSTQREMLL